MSAATTAKRERAKRLRAHQIHGLRNTIEGLQTENDALRIQVRDQKKTIVKYRAAEAKRQTAIGPSGSTTAALENCLKALDGVLSRMAKDDVGGHLKRDVRREVLKNFGVCIMCVRTTAANCTCLSAPHGSSV